MMALLPDKSGCVQLQYANDDVVKTIPEWLDTTLQDIHCSHKVDAQLWQSMPLLPPPGQQNPYLPPITEWHLRGQTIAGGHRI